MSAEQPPSRQALAIAGSERMATALRGMVEAAVAAEHEFFRIAVRCLAEALQVRDAMIATFEPGQGREMVRTVAVWSDGKFLENFSYALAGTPCQEVLQGRVCVVPDHVQEQYPEDLSLRELAVESYAGRHLVSRDGELLGLLALLHGAPMALSETDHQILALVSGYVAVELDRRRAIGALRRAEREYRELFEKAPVGIYRSTREGPLLRANPALVAMLGFGSEAELRAHVAAQGAPYVDPSRRAAFIELVETDGAVEEFVSELRRRDGETIWVSESGAVVRDDDGRVLFYEGIIRDITAQRHADAEQARIQRKLQEVQKLESLGVLAGGIAHDFNNLLTGVLGGASLARAELPPGARAQSHLEQIEVAAQRAADLCRQMLAYSGRGRFVIEPLDLTALVMDTVQLLELSVGKQAILKFNLHERLPRIAGDATQIRQVIMNLVINASEALGDRGGVISLTTGVMHADRTYLTETYLAPELGEGDFVLLEVGDNGMGMAPEVQARIFDPFFTTKFTGRGLGLAAVLGIVQGHRGAIKVYSEPGKGTTVKILLPIDGAAVTADYPMGARGGESKWMGTGTLLVVDDEPTVRAALERMLAALGFQTILAVDGRDALDKMTTHGARVEAVLLDLTMPNMGGEETFRELRRHYPGLPVLLLSGFTEDEAVARFTGKGLAGFLQKPFKMATLREQLQRVLDGA